MYIFAILFGCLDITVGVLLFMFGFNLIEIPFTWLTGFAAYAGISLLLEGIAKFEIFL